MAAENPNKEDLKRRVCAAIDRRKHEFVGLAKDVFRNPETGFKETNTARAVARFFDIMGVPHRDGLAVTGVKARIHGGGGPGPCVAILGELDSLIVNDHPNSDAHTGAAHACGHNAQLGMMLGAAIGLMDQGTLPYLVRVRRAFRGPGRRVRGSRGQAGLEGEWTAGVPWRQAGVDPAWRV